MLYWDTKIATENVRPRLIDLGREKAIVYAISCASHSMDQIAESPTKSGTFFASVSKLLTMFWQQYPDSLRPEIAMPIARAAASITPDEDGPEMLPGEAQIVWSVAYGSSAATREKYNRSAQSEVLSCVDQAYQAVFSFFHEQVHTCGTDEEIREVEIKSKECISEINFQLSLLGMLELINGQPPDYAMITKQMNHG